MVAAEGCCGGGGDGFTKGWLIFRFGCLVFDGGGDGFTAGLVFVDFQFRCLVVLGFVLGLN